MADDKLKATEKQEINADFDEVKEIYLFSKLLARALIKDTKGRRELCIIKYKASSS